MIAGRQPRNFGRFALEEISDVCNDDGGQLHTNPAQSTARDARDTGLQGYLLAVYDITN